MHLVPSDAALEWGVQLFPESILRVETPEAKEEQRAPAPLCCRVQTLSLVLNVEVWISHNSHTARHPLWKSFKTVAARDHRGGWPDVAVVDSPCFLRLALGQAESGVGPPLTKAILLRRVAAGITWWENGSARHWHFKPGGFIFLTAILNRLSGPSCFTKTDPRAQSAGAAAPGPAAAQGTGRIRRAASEEPFICLGVCASFCASCCLR